MQNQPLISVLMPVYNCENYILEAVESILQQTYSNFELLLIDDCSTDSTVEKIKSLNDDRIQLIEKPKNSGYTNSLNYGIKIARGDYIARMDGDDVSLPTRFEEQINAFDRDKNLIVCGCGYEIINGKKVLPLPENNSEIKISLLSINSIVHPSVLIKKSILQNNLYEKNKEPAEDYDLWTRLILIGKFYNIPKVLLRYRAHEQQISKKKRELQKYKFNQIRLVFFKTLDYDTNKFPDKLILKFLIQEDNFSNNEVKLIINWAKHLKTVNAISNDFEVTEFNKMINFLIDNFIEKTLLNNRFTSNRILLLTHLNSTQLEFVVKSKIKKIVRIIKKSFLNNEVV